MHWTCTINLNVNRLSCNLSHFRKDLIRIQWHRNRKVVFKWNVAIYLTLMLGSIIIILNQSSHKESIRSK